MALSLDSIYRPMRDYFLDRFQLDADGPVVFRFDKFGSVLSDDDFIDENHPDLGYLPALAREKFSELVNHIPVDAGDGMNIVLSDAAIDATYYYRLLLPSAPFVLAGTDDASAEAIMSAFGVLKNDALKLWDQVKSESSSGLMLEYKPALATPEDWYDRSSNESWIRQTFQVSAAPSPVPAPPDRLWRLKLSDAAMTRVLRLPEPAGDAPLPARVDVPARVLELQMPAAPLPAGPTRAVAVADDLRVAESGTGAGGEPPSLEAVRLHDNFLRQVKDLDVSRRVLVTRYIGELAPRQPVRTDSVSISFDYCLVSVRRPWYKDVFVNHGSWWLPNVPKGQLSADGSPGALAVMPIGFVAIRSLSIQADWTQEDLASAAVATDFGPFKVTADLASGRLVHEGVQIAGWLLQKMPTLPPNDPPPPAPSDR